MGQKRMLSWFSCLGTLFIMAASALSAQAITVKSPVATDKVSVGQTIVIKWDKSGTMNEAVKIRLYSGAVKVADVVNSAANNGSFSWTIPDSVKGGFQYTVRVATVDSLVKGDSAPFLITPKRQPLTVPADQPPPQGITPGGMSADPYYDFVIYSIFYNPKTGALSLSLGNNGNRPYRGPLTFTVSFLDFTNTEPMQVSLNAVPGGGEVLVQLPMYLYPEKLFYARSAIVTVDVNPDGKVQESNKNNNRKMLEVRSKSLIMVEKFDLKVVPATSNGPYPVKAKAILTMKIYAIVSPRLDHEISLTWGGSEKRFYLHTTTNNTDTIHEYEFDIPEYTPGKNNLQFHAKILGTVGVAKELYLGPMEASFTGHYY